MEYLSLPTEDLQQTETRTDQTVSQGPDHTTAPSKDYFRENEAKYFRSH